MAFISIDDVEAEDQGLPTGTQDRHIRPSFNQKRPVPTNKAVADVSHNQVKQQELDAEMEDIARDAFGMSVNELAKRDQEELNSEENQKKSIDIYAKAKDVFYGGTVGALKGYGVGLNNAARTAYNGVAEIYNRLSQEAGGNIGQLPKVQTLKFSEAEKYEAMHASLMQTVTPFVATELTPMGRIAKLATGVGAYFFTQDPEAAPSTELLRGTRLEHVPGAQTIIASLQKNPDDTELEKRTKNLVDGALGETIVGPIITKSFMLGKKAYQGVMAARTERALVTEGKAAMSADSAIPSKPAATVQPNTPQPAATATAAGDAAGLSPGAMPSQQMELTLNDGGAVSTGAIATDVDPNQIVMDLDNAPPAIVDPYRMEEQLLLTDQRGFWEPDMKPAAPAPDAPVTAFDRDVQAVDKLADTLQQPSISVKPTVEVPGATADVAPTARQLDEAVTIQQAADFVSVNSAASDVADAIDGFAQINMANQFRDPKKWDEVFSQAKTLIKDPANITALLDRSKGEVFNEVELAAIKIIEESYFRDVVAKARKVLISGDLGDAVSFLEANTLASQVTDMATGSLSETGAVLNFSKATAEAVAAGDIEALGLAQGSELAKAVNRGKAGAANRRLSRIARGTARELDIAPAGLDMTTASYGEIIKALDPRQKALFNRTLMVQNGGREAIIKYAKAVAEAQEAVSLAIPGAQSTKMAYAASKYRDFMDAAAGITKAGWLTAKTGWNVVLSNRFMTTKKVLDNYAATAVGTIFQVDAPTLAEANAFALSIGKNQLKAMRAGFEAFKDPNKNIFRFDLKSIAQTEEAVAKSGFWGRIGAAGYKYATATNRFSIAADAMDKYLIETAYLESKAVRFADDLRLTGVERDQFIMEFPTVGAPDDVKREAYKLASKLTAAGQIPADTLPGKLVEFIENEPTRLAQFIVPFPTTGINSMVNMAEQNPFTAAISRDWRRAVTGTDVRARTEALTSTATGTGLLIGAYHLYNAGVIEAETDFTKTGLYQQGAPRSYSIVVGDKRIQLKGADAFTKYVQAVSYMRDIMQMSPDQETSDYFKAMFSMASGILFGNQNMLEGMANIGEMVEAITDGKAPTDKKWDAFYKWTAGTFTPVPYKNQVRDITRLLNDNGQGDPTAEQVDGFLDYVKYQYEGMLELNTVYKKNIFNQPLRMNIPADRFSPFVIEDIAEGDKLGTVLRSLADYEGRLKRAGQSPAFNFSMPNFFLDSRDAGENTGVKVKLTGSEYYNKLIPLMNAPRLKDGREVTLQDEIYETAKAFGDKYEAAVMPEDVVALYNKVTRDLATVLMEREKDAKVTLWNNDPNIRERIRAQTQGANLLMQSQDAVIKQNMELLLGM